MKLYLILLLLLVAAAPQIADTEGKGLIKKVETKVVNDDTNMTINVTTNETIINISTNNATNVTINQSTNITEELNTTGNNVTDNNQTINETENNVTGTNITDIADDVLELNETNSSINQTNNSTKETSAEVNETNSTQHNTTIEDLEVLPNNGTENVSEWPENIPTGEQLAESEKVFEGLKQIVYVRANGNLIATASDEIKYYHTDVIGSPRILSTETSEDEKSYSPFGAQLLGAEDSGPGFTGHQFDKESDLVYAGARYYDPELRIWISPDPIMRTDKSSYAYVENNPLRYVDPDGMDKEESSKSRFMITDPMDRRVLNLRKVDSDARLVDESIGLKTSFSASLKFGKVDGEVSASVGLDSSDGLSDSGSLSAKSGPVSSGVGKDSDFSFSLDLGLVGVGTEKTETGGKVSANALGLAGMSFEAAAAVPESTDYTRKVSLGPSKKSSLKLGPVTLDFEVEAQAYHSQTQRKANNEEE